jgi:hypothetical protein
MRRLWTEAWKTLSTASAGQLLVTTPIDPSLSSTSATT